MLVHYIQFFYPVIMVSETSSQSIMSREEMPDIPEGAYAFNYYDRVEAKEGEEVLVGENKNWSGTVYFGKKLNLEDVKRLPRNTHILQNNMKCNKWEYIVQTIMGNCLPINEHDLVIRPDELKDFHHTQVWK